MSDITISKDYYEQLLAIVEAARVLDAWTGDVYELDWQPLHEALAALGDEG